MSDEEVSEAESENTECPQLEYILEYVTRNPDCSLPSQALHDLLSLVCEEPSQPSTVPPYLLVAGCRAIFTPQFKDVFFEEALSALEQLNHLEKIREKYVRALRSSHVQNGKNTSVDKIDRETSRMHDFTWIALRRWILINEIRTEPFTPMNCLATINVLYAKSPYDDATKERTAAMTLLQKVKQFVKIHGGEPIACPQLRNYETSVPYTKAYIALSRYLDLTQELISTIEDLIDPIPQPERNMGIKRTDCVMHRISRHLISTDKLGFNPSDAELLGGDSTQSSRTDQTQRSSQARSSQHAKRSNSPEI
ncbi:Putative uncharacterized protein [Taphrina deformans PYCC 5710]|uniref:Uncharacterized protein n=1 Tax=Taphrina deformans (strain PYCC 5710 / ATCC 11124 / CBS 356.35 / IMI 108563 / JCM 9778 / NBRC 8474) TaxID=1097556 RepID=R4X8D9_TAPDE|nr:Putative uncharacterized protein [Taphrina deformans PYCC 5710]|eukprot:CCG81838.1 Putative uncharacterized protein [Taphrina deformans PYCC 5710]